MHEKIEALKEKTIDALAEEVERVGQCDNLADAQIMEAKFKVLNETLRTLDEVDEGWEW